MPYYPFVLQRLHNGGVVSMQSLKSIVERNIDLERQKLYKEQQYKAYQNQEAHGLFLQEVSCIQNLFQQQNPVYNDFFVSAEISDESRYQVRLYTVRQKTLYSSDEETEYVYRGHVVKKTPGKKLDEQSITNLNVTWLSDQYKWAVIRAGDSQQSQVVIIGDRNNLIQVFFNLTVKDIARVMEDEANEEARLQQASQEW